jgi:hypothetical protein
VERRALNDSTARPCCCLELDAEPVRARVRVLAWGVKQLSLSYDPLNNKRIEGFRTEARTELAPGVITPSQAVSKLWLWLPFGFGFH